MTIVTTLGAVTAYQTLLVGDVALCAAVLWVVSHQLVRVSRKLIGRR